MHGGNRDGPGLDAELSTTIADFRFQFFHSFFGVSDLLLMFGGGALLAAKDQTGQFPSRLFQLIEQGPVLRRCAPPQCIKIIVERLQHPPFALQNRGQSQVWLVAEPEAGGRLHLRADSDAVLVKGLISLLLRLYDRRTPAEILANPPDVLERIGLAKLLTPGRSNGLYAMVGRIRGIAEALTEARAG